MNDAATEPAAPIAAPGERPPDDGFIGSGVEPDDWELDHGELLPAALDAESHVLQFQLDLRSGRHWFDCLLDAVSRWTTPREVVDGREYQYLIAGEAFDWLALAERLAESAPELLPEAEVDALLWQRQFPLPLTDDELQQRFGAAKYWAYLNFEYGVRVEQALQLAVERNLEKEAGGLRFSHGRRDPDRDVHQRIYGAGEASLLEEFRDAQGRGHSDRVAQIEWQAFTYWLFRRRVERQDPARVASDTRRGLQMMQELEEAGRARRRREREAAGGGGPADDAIEAVVVAVG